jgi:hypothetical protein
MRILFYIQRLEDAHMAQAMALLLKEKLGASAFAALTFRQAPEGAYLAKEAASLFPHLLSETEMHRRADEENILLDQSRLNRLESDYGLPFWQYVTQNRFLTMRRANHLYNAGTPYSREELLKHVQVRFDMIEAFLDSFKPTLIIFPVDVGPSSALILERVAKARGIPVFVPISSKLGSYHTIIDTVFSKASNVEKRFNELQQGYPSSHRQTAQNLIGQFRNGGLVPSYIQGVTVDNFEKVNPKAAYKKLQDIIERRTRQPVFKENYDDIYNLSQSQYDRHRAALYYRRFYLRAGKFFESPQPGEKFVFFPFHVEPELALLLYAPFQTHQSSVAQNVAQSLPSDTCLYVKEHPQAVGVKDLGFYKRVRGMHNVRMLYPHLSSRALIAASEGVVTITGTAGMEAMLMGKPAVTLGDVFYTFVPQLVTRAESIEDLPKLVRNFATFKPDEALLTTFVTALLDESIAVDPEGLAAKLAKQTLEYKLKDPDLLHYTNFLCHKIQARLQPRRVEHQVA